MKKIIFGLLLSFFIQPLQAKEPIFGVNAEGGFDFLWSWSLGLNAKFRINKTFSLNGGVRWQNVIHPSMENQERGLTDWIIKDADITNWLVPLSLTIELPMLDGFHSKDQLRFFAEGGYLLQPFPYDDLEVSYINYSENKRWTEKHNQDLEKIYSFLFGKIGFIYHSNKNIDFYVRYEIDTQDRFVLRRDVVIEEEPLSKDFPKENQIYHTAGFGVTYYF